MNSIPGVTKWMKGKFLIKVVLQLIRTRGIKKRCRSAASNGMMDLDITPVAC